MSETNASTTAAREADFAAFKARSSVAEHLGRHDPNFMDLYGDARSHLADVAFHSELRLMVIATRAALKAHQRLTNDAAERAFAKLDQAERYALTKQAPAEYAASWNHDEERCGADCQHCALSCSLHCTGIMDAMAATVVNRAVTYVGAGIDTVDLALTVERVVQELIAAAGTVAAHGSNHLVDTVAHEIKAALAAAFEPPAKHRAAKVEKLTPKRANKTSARKAARHA